MNASFNEASMVLGLPAFIPTVWHLSDISDSARFWWIRKQFRRPKIRKSVLKTPDSDDLAFVGGGSGSDDDEVDSDDEEQDYEMTAKAKSKSKKKKQKELSTFADADEYEAMINEGWNELTKGRPSLLGSEETEEKNDSPPPKKKRKKKRRT